jgi:hypothetical protein
MTIPIYRLDLSKVFPEVPSGCYNTADADQPVAALSMVVAYLLSGHQFDGALATLPVGKIHEELSAASFELGLPLEKIFEFARGLLVPLEHSFPMDFVPREVLGFNYSPHEYQVRAAAWAAARTGCILNFDCGVGKTYTAVMATLTAVRAGQCSRKRCFIVAPLTAVGTWDEALPALQQEFELVRVVSFDSLHHLEGLDWDSGGALIIDEAHAGKNADAKRSRNAFMVRTKFQWCTCLTATLLHTGCEALIALFDLACPGLSRFMSKWELGRYLDVIVTETIPGVGRRRRLVVPGADQVDALAHYMERAAVSLTYDHEDVAKTLNLPPLTREIREGWVMPEWTKLLHPNVKNPETDILWGPTHSTEDLDTYAAALTLALKHRNDTWLAEQLLQHVSFTATDTLSMYRYVDSLVAKDPENGLYLEWQKKTGIPKWPAVNMALRVDGQHDRVIIKRFVEGRFRWEFAYAPWNGVGFKPGPKHDDVLEWLQANPDESLFVSAFSTETNDALEHLLSRAGIISARIHGGVPRAQRDLIKRQFADGSVRVLLGQSLASSVSISLVRANTTMVLDHDSSPITNKQLAGRTWRQGQKRPCLHIDFSFNAVQRMRIESIRRQDDFDRHARRLLEGRFAAAVASQVSTQYLA